MTPALTMSTSDAERAYAAQTRRLRVVAIAALPRYGLERASVALLSRRGHTLFRVESPLSRERFVLRVYSADAPPVAVIASELAWLLAIHRETSLVAPEPVPALDGSLVQSVALPGGMAVYQVVLFRWVEGRFVDAGLRPTHLVQIGRYLALLHQHAARFTQPPGFHRPTWNWRGVFGPSSVLGATSSAQRAERNGHFLLDENSQAIFQAAADHIGAEMAALPQGREHYGLIHADFQQTNYLFHQGEVRAIDFADCCYASFYFDLAIPLFELQNRPNGADMRAAFLMGYRANHPLAADPQLRARAPQWANYTADWLREFLRA